MTSVYPPDEHLLRDLPFSVEVIGAHRHRAHLLPLVQSPDSTADPGSPIAVGGDACSAGEVPFGVTATVVDVLAGALCAGVVAPDWMATSVLALHISPLPADGSTVLDATVVRAGRSSVTIQVSIENGSGSILGEAMAVFSRLERRESNLTLAAATAEPGTRYSFHQPGRMVPLSFPEMIGCVVTEPSAGVTETEIGDPIRNSFGAVNGGVVAAIAEVAARGVAASELRSAVRTNDATVHYLGQGRVGPVRTEARTVRRDDHSLTVAVDVLDVGQVDESGALRHMASAHFNVSLV